MRKVKLTLEGLNGNAYALLGAYTAAARRQGFTKDEIDAVCAEATTGDYNHLLSVLMAHTVSDVYEDEGEYDDEGEF